MILSKEQTNRYLRHIIIPEISGEGQMKLLESTALICGENVAETGTAILYLAAMGIGKIYCKLEDKAGCDTLFSDAMDLNNDVDVELINENIEPDFRIVLGNCNFIKKSLESMKGHKFAPTIISVTNGWKALCKTFKESQELFGFAEVLKSSAKSNFHVPFATAASGAICSIEGIKLCLSIGNILSDLLLFDLFNMEFTTYEKNEGEKAIEALTIKAEKEINYENIKEKLSKAKVLIVGAGGLGSPTALALTMAGVGTIGLVDSDRVEASNLNRQILHAVSRIGKPKAESAEFSLRKINPEINVNTYIENLTKDNAREIIEGYDLVVSAVDNIQTRYLINDVCYFMKKTVIEAGVRRFDGTNTTVIPGEGHCYRCLFPNLSTGVMSCAEKGVLGAVPGIMGFIQAAEAFKIIAGEGITLKNKILLFDGLEMEFNVINLGKNPDCPICGKNPTITELQDYTIKYGNEND